MGRRTAAERLADLEERRANINAEIQRVRAREQQQQRRDETRRKILLGSLLMELVERGEWTEHELRSRLDRFLTRDNDRRLFGLIVSEGEDGHDQGEPTP